MKLSNQKWTIGQLARRVNMRTSALRYYEDLGLLPHPERTESGYRLYNAQTEQALRFIQRGQQLGFSLDEIKILLDNWQKGHLKNDAVVKIAEGRYLALEEQITQTLVVQHELSLFLQDIVNHHTETTPSDIQSVFDHLLDRVCADPVNLPPSAMFEWLLERSGCTLSSDESKHYLDQLAGKHIHVWQEDEGYAILVVDDDPETGKIMEAIANLETNCQVHHSESTNATRVQHDEGFLLKVNGQNAFIFARIFLALERTLG